MSPAPAACSFPLLLLHNLHSFSSVFLGLYEAYKSAFCCELEEMISKICLMLCIIWAQNLWNGPAPTGVVCANDGSRVRGH
ncbi:hypothetical protein BC830DRAFT_1118163 [Chytriomyces sp. MP71]|nr:hypothetical protein BC830DRAFT_1118163 [Chytriomyces sp. MP71]